MRDGPGPEWTSVSLTCQSSKRLALVLLEPANVGRASITIRPRKPGNDGRWPFLYVSSPLPIHLTPCRERHCRTLIPTTPDRRGTKEDIGVRRNDRILNARAMHGRGVFRLGCCKLEKERVAQW